MERSKAEFARSELEAFSKCVAKVYAAADARDLAAVLRQACDFADQAAASSRGAGARPAQTPRTQFLTRLLRHHIEAAQKRMNGGTKAGARPHRSGLLATLTNREAEVFEWIAEGKRDKEIAAILAISTATVKTHVRNILLKLQLENRTSVAAMARFIQSPPTPRASSASAGRPLTKENP